MQSSFWRRLNGPYTPYLKDKYTASRRLSIVFLQLFAPSMRSSLNLKQIDEVQDGKMPRT